MSQVIVREPVSRGLGFCSRGPQKEKGSMFGMKLRTASTDTCRCHASHGNLRSASWQEIGSSKLSWRKVGQESDPFLDGFKGNQKDTTYLAPNSEKQSIPQIACRKVLHTLPTAECTPGNIRAKTSLGAAGMTSGT